MGGGTADDETVRRLRDALVSAVRSGELPEERTADAAERVRLLARWTSAGATDPGTPADEEVGLRAARRALRITGANSSGTDGFTPLTAPPYVAAFTPIANFAVGDETPWGVAAELARLLPGTETGTFAGDTAGLATLAAAGPRRIVAVVRDEHRHPWMAAALDTVLRTRPDTVVVEMGLPQAPPRGALHIATHGAARVCGRAAAEIITGK